MPAIEVVPAGNQRYGVVIRADDGGETRHEVDLPDPLLLRMDTTGLSMQDVVAAALEFVIEQEGLDHLDRELDLDAFADRYAGFVEEVPERASRRATDDAPPPGFREADTGRPTGDERLRLEVEEEQRQGRASSPDRRL